MSLAGAGLQQSLLGVADPAKFVDPSRLDIPSGAQPSIVDYPGRNYRSMLFYTLTIVFMSALIFVTVVSIFEVIKYSINYGYAVYHRESLVTNLRDLIITSGYFALITTGLSVILIPAFAIALRRHFEVVLSSSQGEI